MTSSFPPQQLVSGTGLPGNSLAPSAARRFVRAALAEWTALGAPGTCGLRDRLVDDAVLLVSELVTNAVIHAGTGVELVCRWDAGGARPGVVVEVGDRHAARVVRHPGEGGQGRDGGLGLRIVSAVAESWGVSYRHTGKAVWFRLDAAGEPVGATAPAPTWVPTSVPASVPASGDGDREPSRELRVVDALAPAPMRLRRTDADWVGRGALSFLAEASDLLAGQLDEDVIASLAGQLLVPRLADWCGVWLSGDGGGPRLARVWHGDERRIDALRLMLEKEPPSPSTRPGGIPWPWPGGPDAYATGGCVLACPLIAGGRWHGTLLAGRAGLVRLPGEVVRLVEDLSRRVALAVSAARQYARQARISRVLQRGLLPSAMARIPGVDAAVVYEPTGEGFDVGGDFYDLFPPGDGRWCFALGDVCGNGPEAASVTGLARHVVRLLAREGYGVAEVLNRLNRTLVEEGAEPSVGEGPRFLSLLFGELVPVPDRGARCTLASAGHPLPLLLRRDGRVVAKAAPQMLMGITEGVEYTAESFDLEGGETLLCVTDGVTERRSGKRQLDDEDGLRSILGECAGMGAQAVAEHVRRAVHDYDAAPPDDDLALMVLQAVPQPVAR